MSISNHLSMTVCLYTFTFSTFSPKPLGQFNQTWHKSFLGEGIQNCSNERQRPCPKYNLHIYLILLDIIWCARQDKWFTTVFIRDWDSHITHIAAISNHDSTFSYYVFPEWPISTKTSEVTGLKVRGQQLFHKGKPFLPPSIKDALQSFAEYLKSHPA